MVRPVVPNRRAVHQPVHGCRLYRIGYTSDLYGVPWFLTLFSHILPLDKAPLKPARPCSVRTHARAFRTVD